MGSSVEGVLRDDRLRGLAAVVYFFAGAVEAGGFWVL